MAGIIVVVDDESEILELVSVLLREEGYEVLSLGDPGLVADLTADVHPCLYLLDLMLPTMSGIELARQLRGDGHAEIHMIAMSASGGLLSSARTTGLFDGTLSKPFELLDLLDMVERYAA